jgi:hypothetical protein
MKQVEPLMIDAALIALMMRDSMSVEELQDLNGDLSSVGQLITELRGDEGAIGGATRDRRCDIHHLRHRRSQKKMIVGDLIDPAEPAREREEAPDVLLRPDQHGGDIAHPRRPESRFAAEERCNSRPHVFILERELKAVRLQP